MISRYNYSGNEIVSPAGVLKIVSVRYRRSGVVCDTCLVLLLGDDNQMRVVMEGSSFAMLKSNMFNLARKTEEEILRQVEVYSEGLGPMEIIRTYNAG